MFDRPIVGSAVTFDEAVPPTPDGHMSCATLAVLSVVIRFSSLVAPAMGDVRKPKLVSENARSETLAVSKGPWQEAGRSIHTQGVVGYARAGGFTRSRTSFTAL